MRNVQVVGGKEAKAKAEKKGRKEGRNIFPYELLKDSSVENRHAFTERFERALSFVHEIRFD